MMEKETLRKNVGNEVTYTNAADRTGQIPITEDNYTKIHTMQEHGWTLHDIVEVASPPNG